MKKINVKKIMNIGLFTFVAATLMFFGSAAARADSNHDNHDHHGDHHMSSNQPRLDRNINVTKTSAVLSFKDRKFRNETVNVVVSIKNRSTGVLVEKAMKASLDDSGNGTVTVKGLKSGTSYSFKVRIMRVGETKTTQNSSDREATTM